MRAIEKYGMINMHSWMFLSSFEKLRRDLLENYHIDSLLHLGPRTFDELSGEVVQNAAFVVTNSLSRIRELENCGTYFRLVDGKNCSDKERMFFDAQTNHTERVYYANVEQGNFEKIPGLPIGYWASSMIMRNFISGESLSSFITASVGIQTGDNGLFMRLWWEVVADNIKFDATNVNSSFQSKKWFPFNKGGAFRKWYGNNEFLVDWQNDGERIKLNSEETGHHYQQYDDSLKFKPMITWSRIATSVTSFRVKSGFLSDMSGFCLYPHDNGFIHYYSGFLNSIVCTEYLKILAPTLNFMVGPVTSVPIIIRNDTSISSFVKQNIEISKFDWDSHETSWDFKSNPLVALCNQYMQEDCDASSYRIENFEKEFEEQWTDKFMQLHENEEELNRQFIEIYGLQDELTPDVPLDEITILQQGEISIINNSKLIIDNYGDGGDGTKKIVWHPDVLMKQLISYAVGCMMGRYSIDKHGLILANQGDGIEQFNELVPNSRFEVDDDGIVPLMSALSDFADNATLRFKHWLSVTFGEDTLVENLNFIEAALGKSIDDYFVKDFWKDHKKMYQNRPIYWLFSSKKGAFQCIAYMHRMDAYTAERIRTKYLLPHIEWLLQKQSEMEADAANLSTRERKQLDNIVKQIAECREYHDRLHVIADQQIAFDLDDGVVVNYAKFGDVLQKLK